MKRFQILCVAILQLCLRNSVCGGILQFCPWNIDLVWWHPAIMPVKHHQTLCDGILQIECQSVAFFNAAHEALSDLVWLYPAILPMKPYQTLCVSAHKTSSDFLYWHPAILPMKHCQTLCGGILPMMHYQVLYRSMFSVLPMKHFYLCDGILQFCEWDNCQTSCGGNVTMRHYSTLCGGIS